MHASAPSLVLVLVLILAVAVASPAQPQSLRTDGNIETDAQLVSKVATGTPPLAVSSSTRVAGLNADRVDGLEGTDLAILILAVQDQVDVLGMARLPRTGQTTCHDAAGSVTPCGAGIGRGQDGDLQLGVTWPNPRFTDNGDGTVSDALTGLVWLEDAYCFGNRTWADALAKSNTLFDGCTDCGGTDNDCGLSDGSIPGQWRLPDVRELQSLVHHGVDSPAVPNTAGTGQWVEGDPFSRLQLVNYWSSTTFAASPQQAWAVFLWRGWRRNKGKTDSLAVWPVRGGD
jgi:hypothetical protein